MINTAYNSTTSKTNYLATLTQNLNSNWVYDKDDSFYAKKNKPSFSKLQPALIIGTGTGLMAAGFARYKTGAILKSIGQKVPFFTIQRFVKISRLISTDSKTGLLNNPSLFVELSKGYEKAMEENQSYCTAILDMDNFKGFNEVFGHHIGDIILKEIGADINKICSKHNAKGYRYGGEEFVVTMRGKNLEEAKAVINELSETIKNDNFIQEYLPEFKEKTAARIKFLTEQMPKFNSVCDKLKNSSNIGKTKNTIISLINEHIKEFKPANIKFFEEIIMTVKSVKNLSIDTKVNKDSTLGRELDKIYSQYSDLNPLLNKWLNHVKTHKHFTISSGIVCSDDILDKNIKGNRLIIIADKALNSAKENGKNAIFTADNSLIKALLIEMEERRNLK